MPQGSSRPRPHIVQDYQQIDNLSAWCDRLLFAIHRGRYAHLTDEQFWRTYAATVRQWAAEQADPPLLTTRAQRDMLPDPARRSWREHAAVTPVVFLKPIRRRAA